MSESAASSFSSSSSSPSARSLPPRPDLDKLRKEARRLLAAIGAGDASALARLDALKLPRDGAALHDAQLILAREYGFPSWRAMKEHVETQRRPVDARTASALLQAVGRGDLDEVRRIVTEQPAAINIRGPHPFWGGRPQPLHVAIEHGSEDVFEYLLEQGADVNGDNSEYDGWSPLMLAVHWKRRPFADLLLRGGVRVGLVEALMLEDDARVAQLLRDDPEGVQRPMPNAATPLHFARTTRAVELLLAAGVSPHAKDKYGKTAMEAAASRGAEGAPVVVALNAQGIAAHAGALAALGDLDGLKQAARNDKQAIHRTYPVGTAAVTPFEAAAVRGHVEVVNWLLDQGVDINQRLHEGQTALHVAAWIGHMELVQLLVDRGADPAARDNRYQGTPLDEARAALTKLNRTVCAEVADYLESLNHEASHHVKETTMNTSTTTATAPTCGVLATQFLVDDLEASIAYYRDQLGFTVDFTYGGFYAGLSRGAAEVHLKHAPKTVADRQHRREHEHLDASVAVRGIDALYAELEQRGANIIKPLESRPWGTRDFYVSDPDGYIISFGQ